MKPLVIVSALLIPAALSTLAQPFVIREFKASPASSFPLPATADSASDQGNSFKRENLLKAISPALRAQLQDWTTMTTDSAGRLSLVKAADRPASQSFATSVRASRFTKGKLRISSSAMAQVLLDGKKLISKTKADSVAKDKDAAVTFLPETDYSIQVNILSLPDDPSAPVFSLEFIPDDGFENVDMKCSVNADKRFKLTDTFLGKRISGVAVSPDGNYVMVKSSETLGKDRRISDAVIISPATGDTVSAFVPDGAKWMPKGARLFYTERRGDTYDVFTIDLPSMKRTLFAKDVPTNSITWEPGGKWFVAYDKVDGKKDAGPLSRVKEPDDRIPGTRDKWYLSKYDPSGRVAVPVTYGGPSTYLSDISPDGKKILYSTSRRTPSVWPFTETTLIQLDAETLRADTLLVNPGGMSAAIYSPDGTQLFIAAGPEFFGKTGVNAGKHPIANSYDTQGYLFDIAARKAKALTRDFNPALDGGYTWNTADNKIYFRTEEGFNTPVYSLDPSTGKTEKIPTELPSVTRFSIGNDESRWMAYIAQSFDNAGVAYILDLSTGKSRLIADPMKETLAGVEFGKVSPWTFKSSKGDIIDGLVCLPPEFDPSKKYPLIVYYYGGTSPSTSGISSPYSPQVFASRDYVVYVVNPSGTTGYGQEYSARHVNAWGDYTADEIIEGTKKFCKAHPFVDSGKIGCIGASYGGFMTQFILTKTDIFSAAVSHAGISNVTSYWGEGYWGYSYNSVAAAKSYPWTAPQLFTRHGSLFNADKIHTPLLLMHGTVDTNVPIGESIQIFNALRILGRDVEFITVDGENHIISDFEKKKLWQESIMAWFAKWLQDDSRWWDSLYGK